MFDKALGTALVLALVAGACSWTGDRTSSTVGSPGTVASSIPATEPPDPPASGAEEPGRTAERIEDLDYLNERIIAQHPDPFWRAGEDAYRDQLDDIRRRAGKLSDDEFGLEIIRLVALIDGHSLAPTTEPPLDYDRFQIRLYDFDDGLYVLDSHEAAAVGGRVVAVGALPAADAMARIEPYVSRDNDMTVRLLAPLYLGYADLLERLGILAADTPAYTVETPDGALLELDPPRLTPDGYLEWLGGFPAGLAPRRNVGDPAVVPLYLTDPDRAFWWTYLAESRTVFIQMNRVSATSSDPAGGRVGITRLASEVREFAAANGVERFVLDLRHNPGGNNMTYGPLLELLSTDPTINQRGRLFVIVGRQTFSAAMNLATEIENETEAIFAGEPTGARPNLFGDVNTLRLPNSDITVRISTRYWPFGGDGDTREWITPTIEVPLSSADYFAGNDPVLDAVIGYEP